MKIVPRLFADQSFHLVLVSLDGMDKFNFYQSFIAFGWRSVTEQRVLLVTRGARLSRVWVLFTGSYGRSYLITGCVLPSSGYVWSWFIRFVHACTICAKFAPIDHLVSKSTLIYRVMHIEILIFFSSVIYSTLCPRWVADIYTFVEYQNVSSLFFINIINDDNSKRVIKIISLGLINLIIL